MDMVRDATKRFGGDLKDMKRDIAGFGRDVSYLEKFFNCLKIYFMLIALFNVLTQNGTTSLVYCQSTAVSLSYLRLHLHLRFKIRFFQRTVSGLKPYSYNVDARVL